MELGLSNVMHGGKIVGVAVVPVIIIIIVGGDVDPMLRVLR